jgi:HEAT repeat protein
LKAPGFSPDRAGSAFRAVLLALALIPPFGGGIDEALEDLRAKLRADDKWVRAEAVKGLARLGSGEAYELVLEALADKKGEVADTAELVLATLAHEKGLELLGGEGGLRSKDALVRSRVAELLGRLEKKTGSTVKLLERALGDDEGEVRRMAAWSIQRAPRECKEEFAASQRLVDALSKRARSDRDPLARARALVALGGLDAESARAILEAAWRDGEPLVRASAAVCMSKGGASGASEVRLAVLGRDPVASVRRVALEALAERSTKGALACLIERLTLETEERMLTRAVGHLQRLSGRKDRRDPRPWRDWLASLPADWKPGRVVAPAPASAEQRSVAALAGLPIVSKRVAILIDLSGSIWNLRPDGKTRKQLVDAKLREALEALPAETCFNLIPYTSEPIPWKPALVKATPANVRAAAVWFEARADKGSGNLWDAVRLALADPEVDTLIVLFDGAPTGGPRHRLELMIPLLLEQNEFRRVAFDLVLVDSTKRLRKAWSELAEGTGGQLVAVSF